VSGLMSQKLRSRKKALFYFITLTFIFSVLYYLFATRSIEAFYVIVFCVGFGTGYWAVFMSSASELFGTNIRATVTTTAPNFVRGSVTLMALAHASLKTSAGYVNSTIIIGGIVFVLAYIAWYRLDETFAKDLNYTE
jgi:MFS transporter, putative metabolite:H+ symporter